MAKRKRRGQGGRASKRRRKGGRKMVRYSRPGRQGLPLGKTFKTKLRYVTQLELGSGTNDFASHHFFRANSAFDPDLTGGGHQPMGFDQIGLFYDHYTVIGSKISVNYHNVGGSNPIVCGIRLRDTNETENDLMVVLEQGQTSYRRMTRYDGGANSVSVSKGCSVKKQQGLKSIIGNDQYTAGFSSNPAEDLIYDVFVGPLDAGTAVGANSIKCLATIVYIVVFTEPRPLPQS